MLGLESERKQQGKGGEGEKCKCGRMAQVPKSFLAFDLLESPIPPVIKDNAWIKAEQNCFRQTLQKDAFSEQFHFWHYSPLIW